MFEIKGILVSAKQKALKVLTLLSGLRKEYSNVSSPTPVFTAAPCEPVSPLPNYSLEAELKKAQAFMYWRIMDRPK